MFNSTAEQVAEMLSWLAGGMVVIATWLLCYFWIDQINGESQMVAGAVIASLSAIGMAVVLSAIRTLISKLAEWLARNV